MTVFLRSALEAIPHLQQAKQCDPNSFFTGYFLAMINDINCGFVTDARAQRRSESCTDQHGHTLDVNLNVYTETTLERRIEAVQRSNLRW
jgi:hypothetical protein